MLTYQTNLRKVVQNDKQENKKYFINGGVCKFWTIPKEAAIFLQQPL